MISPGYDHKVLDSKGKAIAVLLRRWYPDHLSVERAKAAYEKGSGQRVTVEVSPKRREEAA